MIKYKVLRKLVQVKAWANTIDERTIVGMLSTLTAILIADVLLLIIGFLYNN